VNDKNQKLRTVLIPEAGLTLEPQGVIESEVETDFSRTISHLVAQAPNGSIMLQSTSGGDLRVATVGIAYEIYDVNAGNAPDVYDAPNTFIYPNAQYVTDFLIETNDATVSWRDRTGAWGDNKTLPVGFYSFDFIHFGVRIQNRVGGDISVYEITCYH